MPGVPYGLNDEVGVREGGRGAGCDQTSGSSGVEAAVDAQLVAVSGVGGTTSEWCEQGSGCEATQQHRLIH